MKFKELQLSDGIFTRKANLKLQRFKLSNSFLGK